MQLKEELSVHGSDEEVDEPLEVDSDEDLSDGQNQLQEEVRMCTTTLVTNTPVYGKITREQSAQTDN